MRKKIESIKIENIGIIPFVEITDFKDVTAIFGDSMNGKTTFLNSFGWGFGSSYPKTIIRDGCQKGEITIKFEGGSSIATFRRQEDGTAIRSINLIVDNKPEKKAIEWCKQNINPFIFEPDLLTNKSDLERKRFLLDICGLDTSKIESDIEKLSFNLTAANKAVLNLPYPVKVENPESLIKVLTKKRDDEKNRLLELFNKNKQLDDKKLEAWQKAYKQAKDDYDSNVERINRDYKAKQAEVIEYVTKHNKKQSEITKINKDAFSHSEQIKQSISFFAELGLVFDVDIVSCISSFIEKLETPGDEKNIQVELSKIESPKIDPFTFEDEPKATPDPDKTQLNDIKTQLDTLERVNIPIYNEYLKKVSEYEQNEKRKETAKNIEREIRDKRKELLSMLQQITEKIPQIQVTVTGQILFNGTDFNMISGRQLTEFKMSISNLWENGIDLEIIDKGGEMGLNVEKTINNLIQYAEANNKHVITSILRETPATIFEKAGVYYIENGNLTKNN